MARCPRRWTSPAVWSGWLLEHWREPDDGVWEVRGPRRQFVHSKVMAWVAVDRIIQMAEDQRRWRTVETLEAARQDIHDEVCREGFDARTQHVHPVLRLRQLDAALLLIPQVGFLPPSDPRVVGTVDAIQRELVSDGFVMRYIPDEDAADGLPPGEGAFLACSFWLVIDLAMIGSRRRRRRSCSNGCSRCATTWACSRRSTTRSHRRLIGNFPQAFTHLTLIAAAVALSEAAPDA